MRASVQTEVSRSRLRVAALVVFGVAFLFRFPDSRFHNEHFTFISGGRQIVAFGELPFRDFVDPGHFLMYFISAGIQLLFGYTLIGELLVSVLALSATASLTFILAARAARSVPVGLLAAAYFLASYPRLYNYYKLFILVFGIYLCWRYIDGRRIVDLVILGAFTAVALLVRQDLGGYLGLASGAMILLVHWREGIGMLVRRSLIYGAPAGLMLLPFFLFLQLNGGIEEYYQVAISFGQSEKKGMQLPPLAIDPASADAWVYYLFYAIPPLAALALLLKRRGQCAAAESMPHEAPKILTAALLTAVAVRVLVPEAIHGRLSDVGAPVAIVGAWLLGGLLGAWKIETDAPRPSPTNARSPLSWLGSLAGGRVARWTVAVVVLGVAWWSVLSMAGAENRWDLLRDGPRAAARRLAGSVVSLRTSPPIDAWAPPGSDGLRGVVRYVNACTRPDDRLVVTSFRPDAFYYSGRGYGGGQPFFHRDHFSSLQEQRLVVERLRLQSAPVVLIEVDGYVDDFIKYHPPIHAYFEERYQLVRSAGLEKDPRERYAVLVDRLREPTGTYEPLGLPCFS